MRWIIGFIGITASLLFLFVSGLINASFGYSIGQQALDAQVYAGLSVASDLLKAVTIIFLVKAWNEKQLANATVAAFLFLVTTLYSLTSAIGFNALNRDTLIADRIAREIANDDLRGKISSEKARLEQLPHHRPLSVLNNELLALQENLGKCHFIRS